MTSPEGSGDVVSVLVHDHREVEEMFQTLERMGTAASGVHSGTLEERKKVVDQVTIELVRHAVAEEQHVYPVYRRILPDGDRFIEHELSEHSDAEKTMDELDKMSADDAQFEEKLQHLMQVIRQHIAEEESELFPKLRQSLSAEELEDLGNKVTTAKKLAPTRPHPLAPDHPPFNKVLDPGAGIVDRLRDAITGRGKE